MLRSLALYRPEHVAIPLLPLAHTVSTRLKFPKGSAKPCVAKALWSFSTDDESPHVAGPPQGIGSFELDFSCSV
eukprot:1709295-Pleurochrysis_carterae.AAC.1